MKRMSIKTTKSVSYTGSKKTVTVQFSTETKSVASKATIKTR